MKKNFVKKLALGLALVMTVGSVNMPVAAEAASEPGFKSTAVKVKVGQTKKYSTNHYGKWSVKKFVIGNKKVATISYSKGSKAVKVTGVAEGATKLRADFKAYKSKREVSARIPVTVVKAEEVVTTAELASVKQTAANAFEATFTADAREKATAESFTIESVDGMYTIMVKNVTFAADGKTATVETYSNFADNVEFNVTCNDKTASFKASVGEVKTVVINTVQAQKNVETDIVYTLYDANGIDVTSAVALNTYVTVTVDGEYTNASVDKASEATITMGNEGDVAQVTVTYDSASGTELVTATGNITCVAAAATVGKTTYFTERTNNYDSTNAALSKVYLNSYAADTVLYEDQLTATLDFAALDSKGAAIDYDSYEVESSNENVLTATTTGASGRACEINVDIQSTGTAQVIVTATKNDVTTVYTGTFTVKAARKATSIVVANSSVSMSNSADTEYDKWVTAYVVDQYGNYMKAATLAGEVTSAPSTSALSAVTPSFNQAYRGGTITAHGAAKGNYVVTLTGSDTEGNEVTKRFTVSVKEVPNKGTVSYKLELSRTSIDLNPEVLMNGGGHNTVVRLAQYTGGIFDEYASNSDVTDLEITMKKGNYYYTTDMTTRARTATAASGTSITAVSSAGITFEGLSSANTSSWDTATDFAENGTYTVKAEFTTKDGSDKKLSAAFTVKNTMELPKVTIVSKKVDANGLADIVEQCLITDVNLIEGNEVYTNIDTTNIYKQTTVAGNTTKYVADTLTWNGTNSNKATIKYVKVTDVFDGTTVSYYVPVNATFTYEN